MGLAAEACLAQAGCLPQQARTVRIAHQTWEVTVAWTEAERERGLSGRDSLSAGEGMWFVLPEPGRHGFWMKDMGFPIDLVWITPQRRVAGSVTLSPCGEGPCRIHYPDEAVSFVLEVNEGQFTGRAGDPVDWHCPP
jgi:hypothetical protein